ncbi:MAG: hypothetical protein NTW66_04220, partial [Candidatus Magasanikbacteria bacterium]|nr:hypothetical protein [Candidatus Magasanikbacteria bacterium]
LAYLNGGRSMLDEPGADGILKNVLDKEQRKLLREQVVSGRFDPCDPGDMVRVCSEILGIEKDSNQYQDFVLQVHFFVATSAPSSQAVNPIWQTAGRPPATLPPPARKNTMTDGLRFVAGTDADSTVPPPEPIGDGDITKVKSADEIELEEMGKEGKKLGDSLTSRLAAIQAENIKLETDLDAIQVENKKLETEVSEAKKAAGGLEKA